MELFNLLACLLEHLPIRLDILHDVLVHLGQGSIVALLRPVFRLHGHLGADYLVEILQDRIEGHCWVHLFITFCG